MQTPERTQDGTWRARERSAAVSEKVSEKMSEDVPADADQASRLDWDQQRRVLQSLVGSTDVGEPLRARLQMLLDQLAADGRPTQSVNDFLETTLCSLGEAGASVELSLELCLQVEKIRNDSGA